MIYPYNSDEFLTTWQMWKDYKRKEHRFRYKSDVSEQAALKKLGELSEDEAEAIEIIMQSISNGWKGLFKLQKNDKTTNSNKGFSIVSHYLKQG